MHDGGHGCYHEGLFWSKACGFASIRSGMLVFRWYAAVEWLEPSGRQQGGDASPSPDLAILPESGVEARSGLPWVRQRDRDGTTATIDFTAGSATGAPRAGV